MPLELCGLAAWTHRHCGIYGPHLALGPVSSQNVFDFCRHSGHRKHLRGAGLPGHRIRMVVFVSWIWPVVYASGGIDTTTQACACGTKTEPADSCTQGITVMPVRKVTENGRTGYQWGTTGKTYFGPGARAQAEAQGRAARAAGYRSTSGHKPGRTRGR